MVLTQWETLCGLFFAFFEKIVVPILTSGGSIPVISTRTKSTAQECAVLFFLHRHSKRRELPTKGKPPLSRLQTLNSCWTFAQNYGIMHSAIAGIVHRLVYQPSKLRRWVRFPLPAPQDLNLEWFGSFLFAAPAEGR